MAKQALLDPVIDLNRQRREREDEDAHRLRRENELDDIAWLMSEKRGRRIMYRLLEMTAVFTSSFTGNSQTFFNEGRRAVGTTLISDISEAGLEELELKMKMERRAEMTPRENDHDE